MSRTLDSLASDGFTFNRNQPACVIRHNNLDQRLQSVLLDTAVLTSLLNSLALDQKVGLNLLEEMVISIFSRLLQFHPLESTRRLPDLDAVYHLGLLLIMITLAFQCESRQALNIKAVYSTTRNVLQRDLRHLDPDLVMWAMLLGYVLMSEVSNGDWLEEKIRASTYKLEKSSWTEVRMLTTGFPWIAAIHDQPARVVVERVSS